MNAKSKPTKPTAQPTTKPKAPSKPARIAANKRARFDFHIEKEYECGLVLEGWEVKSLRSGKAQLSDSYVKIRRGDAWLIGALITPLSSASTHINPDPTRSRHLLLHRKEIDTLSGLIDQKGFTLVALELYWRNGKCKIKIGLAKGKKLFDKRQTIKEREWTRERGRAFKEAQK